ncbi:hypothetical protein RHOSPDRAFT_14898 [Rhodotorula sp. JG-1b]|nr:hypothetical protein RHOSPDRAFT_14898 [Rhodotorula sp. JG-1b]
MPSLLCPAIESAESRRLGPTEASYYLGSRGEGIEGGVNDMYLHIGFSAPARIVTKKRVLDVWSQILHGHPLLSATVEFRDYTDIRFQAQGVHADNQELHPRAQELCQFESGRDASTIISSYLNGPRTLSDDKLSQLTVSAPEKDYDFSEGADGESPRDFDFYLFSTHFLGDGMALHSTAHEFFGLLSQSGSENGGGGVLISPTRGLPSSMEDQLEDRFATARLAASAARVDFAREQARQIGGHAFRKARLGTRYTLILTHSYSPEQTRRALCKCKHNGVSIANAMFTLSTFAYLRSTTPDRSSPELPVMLYSALNVRPYLNNGEDQLDWYHIAIGYYNITLPAFHPSTMSTSAAFWLRAQSVKKQTNRIVKSPFLISRTLCMAKKREAQSIRWEREADEKKKRFTAGQNGRHPEESNSTAGKTAHSTANDTTGATNRQNGLESATSTDKAPQTALMGLSMLGNLDGIYQHASYDSIGLHSLTTGSRQRPGALLLFAYTFAGKLWISLGYDSNGFESGVIEGWWKELLAGVDEFLLSEGGTA